jgi:serine/threonine protein kinase
MKIMARLRNPHITQLYGACLEPKACLVREYAANKSLDHYLAANSISLIKKITIGAGIAKGLHHLHESEVLHRDLKPGNVLIDEHGVPKLTDFGLSKTLDRSIGTINDRTDAIAWMAPEAIGAKSIHTTKSEVYSFGLVLWCLMTEQQPFADQLLLEPANAGHVRAMTNLGSMLLPGYGVEANVQEAKKWLMLAAEKGGSEAQALLDSARGFDGQPLYSWISASFAQRFKVRRDNDEALANRALSLTINLRKT